MRKNRGVPLTVGLQAFTCSVVLQAILESDNVPVFFDISSKYYTTLIEDIDFKKIDVLILTHLFGIPNPDYFKICNECKSNKVFLIDDMAMSFDCSLNSKKVGKDSDAAFYSFGFDKPVSVFQGGLIRINNIKIYKILAKNYKRLPEESHNRQLNDLIKLRFLYDFYHPKNYHSGATFYIYDTFVLFIKFNPCGSKKIMKTLTILRDKVPFVSKMFSINIVGFSSKIKIFRMGRLKLAYLQEILKYYEIAHNVRISAAKKCKQRISQIFEYVTFPLLLENVEPSWHRLPAIVPEHKKEEIINWGKRNRIEIGSYNWRCLCFDPYKEFAKLSRHKFPNSKMVTKQIINFPIWAEEIWDSL